MSNEDRAARYHRLRRRASLASTASAALWLLLLLVTGASAALRAWSESLVGNSFFLVVAVYTFVLVLLSVLVQLPFSIYEDLVIERRYELSTQSTRKWCLDQFKGMAVVTVLGTLAALIIVGLLRWTPDYWWLVAAICFCVLLIGLAQLAPVILLPLFYDFKPLDRAALADRLVALAERSGARVLGVFEWRMSDRTRKANAALTGIGRTRRILLSDTLLADHSDDEIEVILAHELAHHVYRDIWTGIALEAGLILAGFYLADVALRMFGDSFGLMGKGDVAALPLVLLAAGAVSIALLPLLNAISRSHERRADRYALEMTRNIEAFVTAMKRLAARNLAEERPSRLVEVLFYTHPPTAARIGAARKWKSGQVDEVESRATRSP
jgi:STE24 endopeptidase